jgi:hypothetical protein
VNEALEVLGVSLVSSDEAAKVLEPRKEAFHLPPTLVTAKGATILGSHLSIAPIGRNQLDPAFLPQTLIERVAVVRLVSDEPFVDPGVEAGIDRLFYERNFSW